MSTQKKHVKSIKTAPSTDDMYWVGIGSSAGGLEALCSFVNQLPQSNNMTYIIVQHLSPQRRSMLVELIARETKLLVKEVSNGEVAQTQTIYITPPNNDVYVDKGRLYLKEPKESIGPKPSVDYCFNSLAEQVGDKAIGVILSGTGSD
ncbi:MAG: chemotaxis protein CheB, partial [Rickettsiales bacterium]|nr:chemotaxis protein CheB [Rickettsiales bacterium]